MIAHSDGSLEYVQNIGQKIFFEVPSRVKSADFGQKSNLKQLSAVNLSVKKPSKICGPTNNKIKVFEHPLRVKNRQKTLKTAKNSKNGRGAVGNQGKRTKSHNALALTPPAPRTPHLGEAFWLAANFCVF